MTEVLTLSTAEFLVLHALLGGPACPGLDLGRMQQLAGDPDATLGAGLDALQRRGLAIRRGNTVCLEPRLAYLGELLFFPDVSVLRWDETDTAQEGFAALHAVGEIILRWTWTPARWEGVLSSDLPSALESLCHVVSTSAQNRVSATLPRAAFPELRARARRERAVVANELCRTYGVDERTSDALSTAFAGVTRQHIFAVLKLDEGIVTAAENLLVFVSNGEAWRVIPTGDPTRLECSTSDREGILRALTSAIAACRNGPPA